MCVCVCVCVCVASSLARHVGAQQYGCEAVICRSFRETCASVLATRAADAVFVVANRYRCRL